MTTNKTRYILCQTASDAALAVRELTRHPDPVVILDCEGRNLGMPDGALSIIAIGDSTASHIFLFDVLAFADQQDLCFSPVLSILRQSNITKLVWDGRADSYEIAETYGVLMAGVIDLQLVEVAQRASQKTRKGWRHEHTARYFKRMKAELDENPSVLDGIYRLYGLEHCANLYHVLDGKAGKSRSIVAMHKDNRSAIWMRRPLPESLLEYSAHDIEIIARLYTRFKEKGGYLRSPEVLQEMTARYMRVYPTRELKAMHVPLDLSRFLPLDILVAPPYDGQRYRCLRCERMLSLACFSTMATRTDQADARSADSSTEETGNGGSLRLTFCRLCDLLARRNSEAMRGEWVVIVV